MTALVWVEGYQVRDFTVGQQVTWPISSQLNVAALNELLGADTAAEVRLCVDWHARQPGDTRTYTGIVTGIESYRCRHADSHVVPGSVEARPVARAVFAGLDENNAGFEEAVNFVGYLVTLANLRATH